jgi:hypothetical protein
MMYSICSVYALIFFSMHTNARITARQDQTTLLSTGVHEFKSSRDPSQVYRVTFGRPGHLECTCEGFRWRGNCKHVREVRAAS